MDTLRWGILSTANIGTEKVIPAMQSAERTEVVAIASRQLDRAEAAAAELGIPAAHGSYEDLLDDPGVDAVYIPLPNHMHASWTVAALEAGNHVLCEKPIGMSSGEAREMSAAAEETGKVLIEAFMYRLQPAWQAAVELVDTGRIGELMAVRSWFSYFNDDPDNIRNIARFGGGGLMDIGCYNVNLSRMLFGAEPSGVAAAMTRDAASGVDILTSAILEFGDKTSVFACSTRATPDQQVQVMGTGGRFTVEIPFNITPTEATRLLVWDGDGALARPPDEILEFAPADQYTLQAEAFAATVLDGAPPFLSMEDSIANMEVIEAIVAAAG